MIAAAGAASLSEQGAEHPTIVSGRASPKRSETGAAVRWWKDKVKITLDASVADLSADAEDAVRGAFGTWLESNDKLPKLQFDQSSTRKAVTLSPDGENRVYFVPITIPGHENDLAITLAYTRRDTGEMTEADLVINAKHPFAVLQAPAAPKDDDKDRDRDRDADRDDDGKSRSALSSGTTTAANCKSTYDVQSVLTHEVGHFFGLGEDTTDSAATMYYSTVPCDLGKRDLAADDSGEMSTLYAGALSASPESDDPGAQVAASCAMSRPSGSTKSLGLVLALSLGLLRRRRDK